MKTIALNKSSDLSTRLIIETVCKSGGTQGVKFEEMRRRIRIMDALDDAPETAKSFDLEDADWSALKELAKAHQWGIATKELLSLLEGIIEPAEPESDKSKPVKR